MRYVSHCLKINKINVVARGDASTTLLFRPFVIFIQASCDPRCLSLETMTPTSRTSRSPPGAQFCRPVHACVQGVSPEALRVTAGAILGRRRRFRSWGCSVYRRGQTAESCRRESAVAVWWESGSGGSHVAIGRARPIGGLLGPIANHFSSPLLSHIFCCRLLASLSRYGGAVHGLLQKRAIERRWLAREKEYVLSVVMFVFQANVRFVSASSLQRPMSEERV